jgi:hypothetical protein
MVVQQSHSKKNIGIAFIYPKQKMFEQTARLKEGKDAMVIPWLQGFVDSVGQECAQYLLQGVGLVG